MTTTEAAPSPAADDPTAAADPAVRPQDDLYRHVNGTWLRTHEIPADRARDGVVFDLRDQAELDVRAIVEESGAGTLDAPDADEARKIAALYRSFMDTEAIEAAGVAPLAPDLALIENATDRSALARAMGTLQRTGVGGALGMWVDTDADDPTAYRAYLYQSGLGLPDESYYRSEEQATTREAYVAHVARMLRLAGVAADAEADAVAGRIMDLETRLAAAHWDRVRDRDAVATHNPTAWAELADVARGFDADAWAEGLRVPADAFDVVVLREPSFFAALGEAWTDVPLEQWREWLTWRVVRSRAPYLTDEIVTANFDFYGRTLTGAQELRERWKRGVALVEGALGEAVGRIYVQRHFPPTHKARMDTLVANLVEAYRRSITSLDWMGPDTRERALAKLAAFTPKIGYPVRWRDYSSLELVPGDVVANVRAASTYELDRDLAKIGRPVDRDEWFMPPQTVNAYYNPGMNEVVFPAAILQPPFFDPDAADAANYGSIGAVIGHEIGHGFDDQGSRYDGDGRLADWWTPEDRAEFETRTAALVAQYDAFSPAQLDGSRHVSGGLTVGENIGDLGGLAIAVDAYEIALGRRPDRAELRELFASWAVSWREKGHDAEVIRLLTIDPHSPPEFRCNGVVANLDAFAEAFDVQPGDGLWIDPQDRVRIW
ncbi:Neprilysin [Beutenbergia cavernae DSM 12333]|uniref:Neprilysin n=1 Tax=Beutenbergia cavernae (strain ATCC BAA-8 / DSM 12333 / CCUG 43141 / JCM 11478 / NBRC 16432 / NCIMB 13614 / HKI 0122) TaxID=471853 RepID=C5BXI3_BEUC1|nr:M13-type metalloendopeptidase [Beutenbergia cavernae]ACQ80866.1 Neprilysin [Beutenbergia cavernae DSM 12333]